MGSGRNVWSKLLAFSGALLVGAIGVGGGSASAAPGVGGVEQALGGEPGSIRNFALGQSARQSTTYQNFVRGVGPAMAVDGGYNGRWHGHSNDPDQSARQLQRQMSMTAKHTNPWWEVDLGGARHVTEIRIWGRADCCRERLSDFYVFTSGKPFASNDPAALVDDPSVEVFEVAGVGPDRTVSIPTDQLARYVRVQIPRVEQLALAEVEVFGPAWTSNLMEFAEVRQSSVSHKAPAQRAADGDSNGSWANDSVSTTRNEVNPWWEADLGRSHVLDEVRVWNRTDCCVDRLSDFYVFTSDEPFASDDPEVLAAAASNPDSGVTAQRVTAAPDPVVSVPVGVNARYVRVQIPGRQHLSLAEVAAFGPQLRNFVPGGVATQSSTSVHGHGPEFAQDASTVGTWNSDEISNTRNEAQPWWQVDLGEQRGLREVRVWNRTDECCVDRLSDFYVFTSAEPFTSDDPEALAADPSVFSQRITDAPNPSVSVPVEGDARYVRVQLAGSGFLSLAEVEAFGTEVLSPPDGRAFLDEYQFGSLLCYSLSTMTNVQWASPKTSPLRFDPGGDIDVAAEWVEPLKAGGMDIITMVTKHHDGFALWPTEYSDYSIAASPYQDGNGDLVADFTTATREAGMGVGLYFSIWDRHNGTNEYIVKTQLRELLTNYGQIDHLWFDSLSLIVRNSKVSYNEVRDFVHHVSPNTILASNNHTYADWTTDVMINEFYGKHWNNNGETRPLQVVPPMDTSKTWFYTTKTAANRPRNPDELMVDIESVTGAGHLFKLGFGPRIDGTLDPRYTESLAEVGRRLDGRFQD